MSASFIGFKPTHDDVMITPTKALEQHEALLLSDSHSRGSGDGLAITDEARAIRESNSRVTRTYLGDISKVGIDDHSPLDTLRC